MSVHSHYFEWITRKLYLASQASFDGSFAFEQKRKEKNIKLTLMCLVLAFFCINTNIGIIITFLMVVPEEGFKLPQKLFDILYITWNFNEISKFIVKDKHILRISNS